MATTNFLLWDPNYTNAENDSQYSADASRQGGYAQNAIVPSALLNKFLIQASQMYTALATMLQNKGITTSDANQGALVSALSNILTSADQRTPLADVLYSASATFDCASNAAFFMILSGNLTSPNFTGITPGTTITLVWQQDNTGGRVITWPAQFFGAGPAQPDPTPMAVSMQSFIALGDNIFRPTTPMTVTAD